MQELTVSWVFSRLGASGSTFASIIYMYLPFIYIYLLPCTAHLHSTFAQHIRPQSSLSLRQFRHVKVVPKWELHMPLATSWVLPLTSLTATPPVSLCLLCCGGTQRPETVECRVPRAETAWAGLPVIGVPRALKTILALTKLTNLCRNVLNVLTCVHQAQNLQRTWVRHSSAMCDLSCSTSVLAHCTLSKNSNNSIVYYTNWA